MTNNPLTLPQGIAVTQLLVIPNQIPKFELTWPKTTSLRKGFGSTGQNLETLG